MAETAQLKEAWEKAKANVKVLSECPLHIFDIDATPGRPMFKRWRCSQCGGEVSSSDKAWYERGQEHIARTLGGA